MSFFWPKRKNEIFVDVRNQGKAKQASYICGVHCKLHTQCMSPRMEYTGDGRLRILVVAEAPGEEEDRRGIQLVGKSGKLLRTTLELMGLDLDKDLEDQCGDLSSSEEQDSCLWGDNCLS